MITLSYSDFARGRCLGEKIKVTLLLFCGSLHW